MVSWTVLSLFSYNNIFKVVLPSVYIYMCKSVHVYVRVCVCGDIYLRINPFCLVYLLVVYYPRIVNLWIKHDRYSWNTVFVHFQIRRFFYVKLLSDKYRLHRQDGSVVTGSEKDKKQDDTYQKIGGEVEYTIPDLVVGNIGVRLVVLLLPKRRKKLSVEGFIGWVVKLNVE